MPYQRRTKVSLDSRETQHPRMSDLINKQSAQPVIHNAESGESAVRNRPALFRALGNSEPPVQVQIGDQNYQQVEIFKHDSWAATAVYENECKENGIEQIVCKFNRQQAIGLLPMRWLGNALARREGILLKKLGDLPNVPDHSGPISVDAVVQRHVVAHEFIPGGPLQHDNTLDESFFTELRGTLDAVHAKGIAYVDLHKRENILVSDEGKPFLIDFQIGFWRPSWQPAGFLSGWFLKMLQSSDRYHLLKHINKCSDFSCEEEINRNRPWAIRVHRSFAVPLRSLRRRLLVALRIRSGDGKAISETNPEVGHRKAA